MVTSMETTDDATQSWPVIDGSFVVGERDAPVAVCTLTTERLPERLVETPGVAIAGQVYTANLGIERIVLNVTANPAIRFLLLCGKDSKLFRPGQSLSALVEEGIDGDRRIIGAAGYEPVLPNVAEERVRAFREQIEVIDWIGEDDPDALEEQISGLAARNPGRFASSLQAAPLETAAAAASGSFISIRPGGQRQPLQYDPKGYFVISIDREEEQVVLQHYLTDHTPAHEMRGRLAEPMYLGLLREGLVTQLSHAAYIGGELAKAEAALHLDLRYRQDRPLTAPPAPPPAAAEPASGPPAPRPNINPPFSLQHLRAAAEGDSVDIVFEAAESPAESELAGAFLEGDPKSPFNCFHRTEQQVRIAWTDETRVVMGEMPEVVPGGIFRVRGTLGPEMRIDAGTIVVLSKVATIV
jgi:tetrahydromethanopterin S-methyltransferase subunit A